MNPSNDLLSLTAFVSALCHAVIILGVSFKLPDIAQVDNTDNTLDVVLINNSNNETPDDAETISTADNEGGGLDDQEATSPLPFEPVDISPIESIKLTAQQELQTSIEPDNLVTQIDSDVKIKPIEVEKTKIEAEATSSGEDKISTKSARKLEQERLLAKIQQNWQDYQKRPRKEFLSPSTKQNEAAQYLDEWRKRVERTGNTNYPIEAKADNLSGTIIISVELNRNGTLSSVNIVRPSKHKTLNDAAVRIIRDSSPFESFPEEFAPTKQIMVITRAFHFLANNQLTSSDASSQR